MKNIKERFTYRGLRGETNFSVPDNVYHGKIIGVKDLITFESDDIEGLEAAFKEAVDDYINTKKVLELK